MPQRRSAAKLRGLAKAGDGKLAPYGARVRRELVQPGFGRAAIVRPRELPTGRLDLIMLQAAATPAKGALAKEGAEAPREQKKTRPLGAVSLSICVVAQLKHAAKLAEGAANTTSARIK